MTDADALSPQAAIRSRDARRSQDATGVPWTRFALFVGVALSGLLLDLETKRQVFDWLGMPGQGTIYWIVEGYVGIETSRNPGALFGFGAGYAYVFAAISVIAVAGIGYWLFVRQAARDRFLTIVLAAIVAGIVGNLYDRLGLWSPPGDPGASIPEVRDWIRFSYGRYVWPNFNLADSFLVCGAAALFLKTLFTAPEKEPAKAQGDAASVRSGRKSD